jgi:hypothetical protein
MRSLAIALLSTILFTGCASVNIDRIIELEHQVSELETELQNIIRWGVDPAEMNIPPELKEEIEDLAVGPPYFETAISIFPGFLLPGMGAYALGDSQTGWNRLGEAYTGVGEFALGTGMTAFSLSVLAMASSSGSSCDGDGLAEFFLTGLAYMITGPIHYFEAWLGDVASTYGSRKSLSVRIARLKLRYLKFMRNYKSACRSCQTGVRRSK